MAGVINSYETVIVVTAKNGEEGNAAVIERYKKLIADNGTVESVDEWGKRRLAYPIQKQTEGYYTLINFKSAPEFIYELERRYRIADEILRTVVVKKDPRFLAPKAKKAAKAVDVEAVAAQSEIEA